MNPGQLPQNAIIRWYETTRRPGLVLAALVFALFARSLPWGFVLDDHRHIEILEDYHNGRRDNVELYRFLIDPQRNAEARSMGLYPWWLGDDVRYQHWRPVAERLLYLEFIAFGRNPLGYRMVNLLVYMAGVVLVLQLLRQIGRDERVARWGALCFALLASHAIPVVFISAQGDPVSLVLIVLALLGAMEFIHSGRLVAPVLATLCYLLALGTKEACLPIAVAPLLIEYFRRIDEPLERSRRLRRAAAITAAWCLIGVIWLAAYVAGGYGSNARIMLDPISDPLAYLVQLPLRAIVLLASLVIPLNPFLFYLRENGAVGLFVFFGVGLFVVASLAWMTYRRHRSREGVAPMAVWMLMFLPLLVCTVPDDRVMMLPSIGFAFLVGAWIAAAPAFPAPRHSGRWVLWVFVAVHPLTVLLICQCMRFVERQGNDTIIAAARGFDREPRPGDCLFFINSTLDSNVLFVQQRLESVLGVEGVHAAFLTDVFRPIVTRTDERTLHVRGSDETLFGSFLGSMTSSRKRPKRVGDEFAAPEFVGRILEVAGDRVKSVEIVFHEPLEADRYRFFECGHWGAPKIWKPPPPPSGVAARGE